MQTNEYMFRKLEEKQAKLERQLEVERKKLEEEQKKLDDERDAFELERITVAQEATSSREEIITFQLYKPQKMLFLLSKSKYLLKGSFTIFLFLVRSHILNSNGVWYS